MRKEYWRYCRGFIGVYRKFGQTSTAGHSGYGLPPSVMISKRRTPNDQLNLVMEFGAREIIASKLGDGQNIHIALYGEVVSLKSLGCHPLPGEATAL